MSIDPFPKIMKRATCGIILVDKLKEEVGDVFDIGVDFVSGGCLCDNEQ